jgi:3-hydroxyacyl-CoA dehydrogenase/enoyl-CoA hydratase/3-hydroxybutyryl-CoA epimerase
MSLPVTQSVDSDGIGWIVFDDPGGRVNVINPATQSALSDALAALASAPVKAVVVVSAKERNFIAGADLKWLGRLPDAGLAERVARDGQELFGRLDHFKVPVVCAIHGSCAGGGLELALACHWRIASDAKETVIGLPEVGLGLIPGWGGCARLPRLVGAKRAAEHILKAALVPAAAAREAGLIDELVPAGDLKARAKAAALKLAVAGRPMRATPPAVDEMFFTEQRKLAASRMRGQPAPLAALEVIERGAAGVLAGALEIEAAKFGEVAAGEVAKNLIHVFFLKEAMKKLTVDAWLPADPAESAVPAPLRRIGIIGAGVMGSGIAQWCATRGFGVLLNDADPAALKRGVQVVRELFHEDEKRGKISSAAAHKALGGIGISTDLQDFEDCEIVIEAVVENVAAKRKLFAELSKLMRPDCILASNTSALPIEEVAEGVVNPGRAIGVHFFNPVGRMPLVELVLGPHTNRETARRSLAFLKELGKSPVICKSSPGFLVTRVLFFYLNEACRLWEQGVPAGVIDQAMRDWGWPMGPLRLIDEVGVDITDFIFGEMKHYFPGRFTATTACARLLAAGLRGRKNGTSTGFYAFEDGKDGANPALVALAPATATAMDATAIQELLNRVMIEETARALAEGVVKTADEADFALLMGAGFPAFRGGLMRYARSAGYYRG